MADLVMGTMGNLIPKLYELLKEEYKLQTGVKEHISSLTQELEVAQAALRKVAEVPWDQIDEQAKVWVRHVREASYDMEDVLDTFLVRVQGPADSTKQKESSLKRLGKKMTKLFKPSKTRRKISGEVKDIMTHLQEVTERYRRYKVDDIVARPATASSTVDPRLQAMYNRVKDLVGIDKSSHELMSMLQSRPRDDASNTKVKIVSVVGVGGLGKTTLTKNVYDKLKGEYDCGAFVPVGRNPDLKKVFKDILIDLDIESTSVLDARQLINKLRSFLRNKRYFIVIDDVWETETWKTIEWFIDHDHNCGGRIIITTRNMEVATKADKVYKLQSLSRDSSRELLYARIYGDERKYATYEPDEISDEILRKCDGIPLSIITMASLLVGKPREKWSEVYKSIRFRVQGNKKTENTMKILSFSYYDLPAHLRTCLLYLSAFPEDSVIPKKSLVRMWVAEGFVQKEEGVSLFEIGEGYFNDLINRSMVQEVGSDDPPYFSIYGCRVHDIVLDFIRSMSREENFFTVFDDNDQGTLVRSNVLRRLAYHGRTMGHSNQANMFDMSKVRSFICLEWVIGTWAPLSSFKLLRVLNIGDGIKSGGDYVRLEHLGHLLHLRFLGINGGNIKEVPEEIGNLKLLQTLDLGNSWVSELPSSSSFPPQLVCLGVRFASRFDPDAEMSWVVRLTSLEELTIEFRGRSMQASRKLVKELGSLRELRVLDACILFDSKGIMVKDLVDSVCHLRKLQCLKINNFGWFVVGEEMEFVLSGELRQLALPDCALWKLPSCINPRCFPNLSHLDLWLQHLDDHDLKTLSGLPELRYLELDLNCSSATIRDISDSDACNFPKLRCLRLYRSMVIFLANKGGDKNSISFHIWDRDYSDDSITRPSVSDHAESLQSDDGLQLQTPMAIHSISDGDELPRPPLQPSKLQHRIVMARPVSVSDEEKKCSISTGQSKRESAGAPRFMPSLQVLRFHFRKKALERNLWDYPPYCGDLGWESLPSLREIVVDFRYLYVLNDTKEKLEAALRHAAAVHPNHPTIRLSIIKTSKTIERVSSIQSG